MKSINRVTLMGNIGKDPDIRSITGGKAIANMAIATTESQKDQAGQWQERTEWHNLVAFGRTAEIVRDYVKKGTRLLIEGKLQTRAWDDRESGQKKYRTEILISDITLLGAPTGSRGETKGNAKMPADELDAEMYITDKDIPF